MSVVAERVRPTVARVDLGVLKSNYRAIREHLARERPASTPGVIAVVKANAYGHGAAQVGRALEDAGADLLACADIEEGATLRAAGVRADILIFGALSVSDLDGLFDCRLTPTISSPGAARAVQAAAARHKQRVRYHLKIDTGMNRLGFRADNLRRTLPELLRSENLDLEAVFTHFATADDPASSLFDEQRQRFEQVLADLQALGARPRPDPRAPRADHRLGLHGHDHDRRDRPGCLARRRGGFHRPPGRGHDRRPRDGGDHRLDSLGDRLPRRNPDRTRLRLTRISARLRSPAARSRGTHSTFGHGTEHVSSDWAASRPCGNRARRSANPAAARVGASDAIAD